MAYFTVHAYNVTYDMSESSDDLIFKRMISEVLTLKGQLSLCTATC